MSQRWRGLVALAVDAIDQGSRAIERVQKETAARPFAILGAIPTLQAPAAVVKSVHDAVVGATHAAIRGTARAVGTVADALIPNDGGG